MTGPTVANHVEFQAAHGIATIAINRPEVMNATATRTGLELLAALERAAGDPQIRAIVLTGRGRGFCAGADMRDPEGPRLANGRPDLEQVLRTIFNPLVLAIRAAPKPVVGAIAGPAIGVGCSIALACDLLVAGESASFIAGFSSVGLSLDGGLSVLLAARVGAARAAEAALAGTPIDAARALDWGLVNRVVPDADLQATAAELAAQLAASAAGALAASKALLAAHVDAGLVEALDREATSQGQRVLTDEYAEGVAAFLERRRPRFV